jgi:putative copper export protein/methionine-rich copper-binding protein CopC
VRRIAVGLAMVVIASVWLVAVAVPASAHAAIESTEPANGELLDESPSQIVLTFTEPPDLDLTIVRVVDSSGDEMRVGPPERAPGSNREIRVPLNPVPDGVYTVTWRTVSSTDGHVTASAFSFGVGVSPGDVTPVEQTGSGTPTPTASAIVGRWMLYVGLIILLGAAATGLLAFGPKPTARPWLLGVAWAMAAVGVVAMTLAERAAVGVPLGTLLSSEAGGKFVLLAVAVVITGIAVLAASVRSGRATLVALAVTAAGAMLARAAGGHASGSPVTVLTQWLHLVGVGAWIGGLVWLVLGLLRTLEPAQIRRFSRLAGFGLLVVVVSGVLRSTNELGGPGWWLHPFQSDYSTTLVVKLAIVLPLLALGALNRYRNIAHLEQRGSRPVLRTVGGELALAAAVFAAVAVLTGLPPQPNAQAGPPAAEPLLVTGSDFATTTRVELRISPGTVGPNAFVATVTDYDTGEPIAARRVSLTFELAGRPEVRSTLELEPGERETWQGAGTALAQHGTWTVTVLVEEADGSVEVPLEVTTKAADQHVDVSKVQGQPDLYTITLEGGLQIQSYVDPGEAGRTNQVHVTAFDADGAELPLHAVTLPIDPPDGEPFEPEMLRFGPGHFAANIDLSAGTWSFDVTAHAKDGRELVASFDQTFEG